VAGSSALDLESPSGDITLSADENQDTADSAVIVAVDDAEVARFTGDGLDVTGELTVSDIATFDGSLPAIQGTTSATITSFTENTTTTFKSAIAWSHDGTNRTITVKADWTAFWQELNAVSLSVRTIMGISFDNGSTWTDSNQVIAQVGANAGAVSRHATSNTLALSGTATADVLVRMQYFVATGGSPDSLQAGNLSIITLAA
jgi:hypothetical protein